MTDDRSKGERFAVVAAAFLGCCSFAIGVGLPLANPSELAWVLQPGTDPSNHFFGWHLFRNGPWSHPIGAVPNLRWPLGTSVGLTDSIPLVAFTLKPFSTSLPAHFQYQGLWLLTCYTLQGVFGARLMRRITRRPLLQVLGAAFLVASPPMLYRHHHEALAAHWQILWAVDLSFRQRAAFWSWLLVTSVTAATHPYTAFMVGVLMIATHVRESICTRRVAAVLGRAAAIAILAAVILVECGYFIVRAQNLQGGSLGYFSMNLLSPVLPLWAYDENVGWLGRQLSGQYEGYGYLGAGLIALAAIALAESLRHITVSKLPDRRTVVASLPLTLTLAALLLLAIGPVVALGPWVLFVYDETVWGPLTVFRASGRMFWPVYYIVILAVLAVIAKFKGASVMLALALLVQVWDVSSHYRQLRLLREQQFTDPLRSPVWETLPRQYRRIILFPTPMCSAERTVDSTPFALLAGRHQLAINAGATSRVDQPRVDEYCRQLAEDIGGAIVEHATLYVLGKDVAVMFAENAKGTAQCTEIDGYDICVAKE